MTLNIALTGNVAAGKSAVLERFRALGAITISADGIVRELQSPGTEVFRAIVDRFGPEVLDSHGGLDRQALRQRVMASEGDRTALEAIVHPRVTERRLELLARATADGAAVVITEIPLLFESDSPDSFDLVVLVDAPEKVRLQRMVESRRMTTDDAGSVIAAQMPAELKRGGSHFVIDNTGDLADLERQVDQVWAALTG